MNAVTSTVAAHALSTGSLPPLGGAAHSVGPLSEGPSLQGKDHPDAELLRIGAELPAVMAALYSACKAHGPAYEAWAREARNAGLLLSSKRCNALSSYPAFDKASKEMSVLVDKVQAAIDRVLELAPQTAEGMAVWAQVVALDTLSADLHDPAQIVQAVEAAEGKRLRSGFAVVVRRLVRPGLGAGVAPAAIVATDAVASTLDGVSPALAAFLAEHEAMAREYRTREVEFYAFMKANGRPDCTFARKKDGRYADRLLHELPEISEPVRPVFEAILAFVPLTLADVLEKAKVVLTSPCAPTDLAELTREEVGSFLRSLAGEAMVREHG